MESYIQKSEKLLPNCLQKQTTFSISVPLPPCPVTVGSGGGGRAGQAWLSPTWNQIPAQLRTRKPRGAWKDQGPPPPLEPAFSCALGSRGARPLGEWGEMSGLYRVVEKVKEKGQNGVVLENSGSSETELNIVVRKSHSKTQKNKTSLPVGGRRLRTHPRVSLGLFKVPIWKLPKLVAFSLHMASLGNDPSAEFPRSGQRTGEGDGLLSQ